MYDYNMVSTILLCPCFDYGIYNTANWVRKDPWCIYIYNYYCKSKLKQFLPMFLNKFNVNGQFRRGNIGIVRVHVRIKRRETRQGWMDAMVITFATYMY